MHKHPLHEVDNKIGWPHPQLRPPPLYSLLQGMAEPYMSTGFGSHLKPTSIFSVTFTSIPDMT